MLELIFDVATESDDVSTEVSEETQYQPKERWFEESCYQNLAEKVKQVR